MDAMEAAFGVAEVVDENMANAARVHAVENGEDLADYTMIAFGGAAPLHAGRLCEKLGVSRCLVPTGAGVGSAIGFLRAPFSFEANKSVFMAMSDFDADAIATLFKELEEEATAFVRSCDAASKILADHKISMRYSGQGWEIPVPLTRDEAATPDAGVYLARFVEHYERLFGRAVEGQEAEVTVWSVNATTETSPVEPLPEVATGAFAGGGQTRVVFDPALAKSVEAKEVARDALVMGARLQGPAVVTEAETTVIVPSSRDVYSAADGTLILGERT